MRIDFWSIIAFQLAGLLIYFVYGLFLSLVLDVPQDKISLDTSDLKTTFWVLLGIWFCQPKEPTQ